MDEVQLEPVVEQAPAPMPNRATRRKIVAWYNKQQKDSQRSVPLRLEKNELKRAKLAKRRAKNKASKLARKANR